MKKITQIELKRSANRNGSIARLIKITDNVDRSNSDTYVTQISFDFGKTWDWDLSYSDYEWALVRYSIITKY